MNNSQLEALAGLNIASHFFYRAFHQAPTKDFVTALHSGELIKHWPLELSDEKSTSGARLISNSLNTITEDFVKALALDYAGLFVGPNKLKAAPWGSVYLSEEQTTCGESTLAIKAFYRECGIEIDTGENEPEDHIGLIFAFLAHLTDQALEDASREDSAEERVQPWLCATQSFLTDHVLTWAPRFFAIMRENAGTDFYKGISLLAEGSLEQLATLTEAEYKIVRLYR